MRNPLLLRFRLALLLSLLVASIPLSIHVYFTASAERETALDAVKLNALDLARIAVDKENETIDSGRQLLAVLAQNPLVQKAGTSCDGFLSNMLKSNPAYTTFIVADAQGNVLCSATPLSNPVNVADRLYFQQVMQTKIFSIGDYIIGRISNEPSLSLGYPIFGANGEVRSVIATGLSLSWLQKIVVGGNWPADVAINIVDRSGIVLARYPSVEGIVGRALLYDPILQDVLTKQEGVVEATDLSGLSRIYAFTPSHSNLNENGAVFFILSVPSDVILAKVRQDTFSHIAILVFSMFTMFVIMWFAGNILFQKFVADRKFF